MALESSASKSNISAADEANSDVNVCTPIDASIVNFHRGAGPGSFFYLSGNKDAKISKSKLVDCIKSIPYVSPEKYDTFLSIQIPDALQDEGRTHGLGLVDLFEVLKKKFEEVENSTPQGNEILDAIGLATLMAMVAPALSPEELSIRFQALCDKHLDEAVSYLCECEKRNGRNEQGFIYLRKQDPVKLANRKKNA